MNRSTDPYFQREGSILLVECKNWSKKAGPPEYEYLRTKLRDRFQRATIGLLVAVEGFTAGVAEKLARANNERELVLPLARADIDEWIEAADRVAWLRERLTRIALRQG